MATKKTTTTTTTRKRSSGSVTKYGILKGFSYFALVISAFIFLFGAIFGQVGAVLNLIGKICMAIGISIPAYDYCGSKKTAWRVIFWIALAVYVFGCVFGLIHG